MSPSPSWITENIYVWRPEGKTFVNVTVFFLGICIVFGTTFGSNGICNLSQKFGVKVAPSPIAWRENCGLSGAGKSSAATYLEDMGYYTVDNVPADIILKFAEFCAQSDGRYDRVALVSDIRSGNGNFEGF